ncbi:hypothetical protein J6590_060841 [Homalodisca vitripennis]|nr:hypothetical protein J6590_060841 [Homalodisca vitripennis]
MAVGDEVENCLCCKLIVNESDIALNCDGFCKEWYHGSCVKISSDEYDKINVLASKVKWYCNSCSEKVERMISKVGNVDDFLGLNNTVKQLVEMVKGVCNNNVCVGEKLSEVSFENSRLCNEITLVKQDIDKLFKVAPTTFSGLNGSYSPPNVRNANTVTNAVDDVVAASNPITKLDNGLGADRFHKVSSRLSANNSDVGVPHELNEELMHPNLWYQTNSLWYQGCVVKKYRSPRNKMVGKSDVLTQDKELIRGS